MFEASRAHLAEAGESYGEHLRFAMTVGLLGVGAGLACVVHAIVPALCQRTCSRTVGQLQRLFGDRAELARVRGEASGLITFALLLAMAAGAAALALAGAGGEWPGLLLAALALGFPATFLLTNPDLEPLPDPIPA